MNKSYFITVFILLLFCQNAYGWDNDVTHPEISRHAIDGSKNINPYLKNNLGLQEGIETILKATVNGKPINKYSELLSGTIIQYIQEGSFLEDKPLCRTSNHFHNPRLNWVDSRLKDELWCIDRWCSGGDYPPENIHSAINWATGYITSESDGGVKTDTGNEWDWDHAREFFYTYLTGKDNNGEPIAEDKSAREVYLAKSMQALGHTMHLLQDMAVPAHVRDDSKSHLDFMGITSKNKLHPSEWLGDRLEHYVKTHSELITGITDEEIPDISITKFWDTNLYTCQDPDEIDSYEIGLAEFTNMNFASKNTIFTEDLETDNVYYEPYPRRSSTNIQKLFDDELLPVSITSEDGVVEYAIYITKIDDGEKDYKFAHATYFTRNMDPIFGTGDEELFFKTFEIDDECAKEYAKKLLPRATGYSAALLDYFFRDNIEISAPEAGLYSIIDGSISPQQFTYIKANLKNNTPQGKDLNGNTIYETMGEGTLVAVAKYKKRTNYEEDLSTDPPLQTDREADFSYSVSEPIEIESLDSENGTDFTFDFSTNPIPAGITDLYLQVIFKGTMGNEKDIAIAVGIKDLNEPMHYTESNNDDRVYLDHVLRTADEIRANETLTARAVEGEIYSLIDPHNISTKIAFYSLNKTPTYYNVTYDSLAPGTYGRLILISDSGAFNIMIHRESSNPLISYNNYYQVSGGVINQMISDAEFHNTNISYFRGIIQHIFHGHVYYYPDNIGISTAPWPEMTGDPVAATTITP